MNFTLSLCYLIWLLSGNLSIYSFLLSQDLLQPVLASLLKILENTFRETVRIVFNQIGRRHGIAKLTHKIIHHNFVPVILIIVCLWIPASWRIILRSKDKIKQTKKCKMFRISPQIYFYVELFFFSVNKIKFKYCGETISKEFKEQVSNYKHEIDMVIRGENTK